MRPTHHNSVEKLLQGALLTYRFISGKKVKSLADVLIDWYAKNKRDLPWRKAGDAYRVWVSEIMLQQTRVETVIPYFLKWIDKFPTLQSLAAASEEEVLLYWEGLGYYTRVRNMHHTARIMLEEHRGIFPESPEQLQALPGIGAYTANAIASICFQKPALALDANGKRVFSRLMDLDLPVSTSAAKGKIEKFAANMLEKVNAGDFNQAVMDLGSLICLPAEPRCEDCPVADYCGSLKNKTQALRPVLKKKQAVPLYQVVAAAIQDDSGRYLLAKRPKGGMLPGLWEFPGGKLEAGEDDLTALKREIREELDTGVFIGALIGSYRHAYTHFKVQVRAYLCTLDGETPRALEAQELVWVQPHGMGGYAMGKVDRLISRDLLKKTQDKE